MPSFRGFSGTSHGVRDSRADPELTGRLCIFSILGTLLVVLLCDPRMTKKTKTKKTDGDGIGSRFKALKIICFDMNF